MMAGGSVFAPTVSVILPTVGSTTALEESMDGIIEVLKDYGVTGEVLVCTDQDSAIAEAARERGGIVVPPASGGYGATLRAALTRVRGDYVAIGDATGAYEFRELPALFEALEHGADLVVGSRVRGDLEPGAISQGKRILSIPLYAGLLNVRYGAGISDPNSGLRAIRRQALEQLPLRHDGHRAKIGMVLDAVNQGLQIADTPISYGRPDDGTAYEPTNWEYLQLGIQQTPADLFTLPAGGLGLLGLAIMVGTFLRVDVTVGSIRLFLGLRAMVAGTLLALVGLQLGLLGALSVVSSGAGRPPGGPVTSRLVQWFSVGRAVGLGLALLGLGAAYAAYLFGVGVALGSDQLAQSADLLAVTVIVLGVQLIVGALMLQARASVD